MPKKILVTGSIAFDTLLNCDTSFIRTIEEADKRSLSVFFEVIDMKKRLGGTGTNIAWNCRLLGNETMLVGTIGMDGMEIQKQLDARGIDTTHVEISSDDHTSFAIMSADNEQHQVGFFGRGADRQGTFPNVESEKDNISYAIMGPRNAKVLMQGLKWCKEQSIPVIFDPGQDIKLFTPQMLQECITENIGMICNEYEWEQIEKMLGHGRSHLGKIIQFLIVTESDKGYSIYTKHGSERFPRCDAETFINPTGAGDGFRGGLLTGLTHGWSLEDSAKLGAAVASFVVEDAGTLIPSLSMEKVYERAKKAYGHELPKL
jgi:adenosine kinase